MELIAAEKFNAINDGLGHATRGKIEMLAKQIFGKGAWATSKRKRNPNKGNLGRKHSG